MFYIQINFDMLKFFDQISELGKSFQYSSDPTEICIFQMLLKQSNWAQKCVETMRTRKFFR